MRSTFGSPPSRHSPKLWLYVSSSRDVRRPAHCVSRSRSGRFVGCAACSSRFISCLLPLLAFGNLRRGGVFSNIIILRLFHLLAAGFYFLNWLMKNGHNWGLLPVEGHADGVCGKRGRSPLKRSQCALPVPVLLDGWIFEPDDRMGTERRRGDAPKYDGTQTAPHHPASLACQGRPLFCQSSTQHRHTLCDSSEHVLHPRNIIIKLRIYD
jgi:hypothetical protein